MSGAHAPHNGSFPPKLLASAFRRPADLPAAPTDLALLRAVQMYLLGEPKHLVARVLGVIPDELTEITQRKGWRFIEDCIREDVRQIAMSNLTRLTHRCFKLLEERLDKGDPIYDNQGDVIGYRAIKAKDLSNMVVQLIDKSDLIEQRTGAKADNPDLLELAESLKNYALEKRFKESKILDGASLQ